MLVYYLFFQRSTRFLQQRRALVSAARPPILTTRARCPAARASTHASTHARTPAAHRLLPRQPDILWSRRRRLTTSALLHRSTTTQCLASSSCFPRLRSSTVPWPLHRSRGQRSRWQRRRVCVLSCGWPSPAATPGWSSSRLESSRTSQRNSSATRLHGPRGGCNDRPGATARLRSPLATAQPYRWLAAGTVGQPWCFLAAVGPFVWLRVLL